MQYFKALVVLLVMAAVCITMNDAWGVQKRKIGKREWFLSFTFMLSCQVVVIVNYRM